MSENSVSIIVPAYNEEAAIGAVLAELQEHIGKWDMEDVEIVVINDGSTDQTAQIVSGFSQVRLINHRKNKGYGSAVKTGIRESSGNIIIWYDADGQHRPEDVLKIINKMQEEELDYCIGIRDGNSYVDKSRSFGKKVLKGILNFITKEELRDFNSGMRGFKREIIMSHLSLLPDTFGASTVTTLLMLEQEYRGGEVDITVRKREGKSSVRQVRDGCRTIALIFQIIILFQPMRVFGKGGL
ncbi:MAG: glycosyltransferase family 2 protein, partial [Lachnospiraceae bacterium]|nr:glycosyltransferase family 2 protein [Lachnospiraceae bacterium]